MAKTRKDNIMNDDDSKLITIHFDWCFGFAILFAGSKIKITDITIVLPFMYIYICTENKFGIDVWKGIFSKK